MVTPVCEKCRRRNVVSFKIEPEEAWRTSFRTVGGWYVHHAFTGGRTSWRAVSVRERPRDTVERHAW